MELLFITDFVSINMQNFDKKITLILNLNKKLKRMKLSLRFYYPGENKLLKEIQQKQQFQIIQIGQ